MKKILFGMFAATALLFTSCSQDEFQLAQNDGEANVMVTLTTPQIGSRAYSDGTTATHLQYALYDVTSGTATRLDKYTVTNETINISKQINFKLVNGHTYRFVFWAAATNADGVYAVNFGENAATFSIDYATYADFFKANLEDLDAFYVTEDVKVTGDVQKTFELRRPFAQINVGTNDYADAAAVGYTPDFSQLTVTNAYSTLDLFTGEVSNPTQVVYNWNAINRTEKFPYDPTNHEYMAMAYVLTGADEAELVTVAFDYKNNNDGKVESRTFGSVPVQRNYRTNIFGSLLTSAVDVNIIIEPAYYDPDYTYEGAMVTRDANNRVVCVSPALPEGVTPASFAAKNAGVVTINAEGEAEYFPATHTGLLNAMEASQTGEIYLAPNSTITVKSHQAKIPATGIKIYGNGATITGEENDFSLDYTEFVENSNVDIYIENLNNARIWGDAKVPCTLNVTLKNCTFIGGGYGQPLYSLGLIMMRGTSVATHNITLEDCYCEGVQVGLHSANAGTFTVKNSTFKGVGIPVNIAKKSSDEASALIEGCEFTKCGLEENGPDAAWDYAAPIRLVDNQGPDNSLYVKVNNCTVKERIGQYDVLLVDYREGKTSYDVKYDVTNSGNLVVKATK